MITEKQAKCLDALRAGGTAQDVRDRLGKDAAPTLVSLRAERMLRCEWRPIDGTVRSWYTHTGKGKRAWLASLR